MFRKNFAVQLLILGAAVLLFEAWMDTLPDRQGRKAAVARVAFEAVRVAGADSRLRVAGAWEVAVDDPRVGGISALAVDGDHLVAVTDAGALVRLPKPGRASAALVRDLPAGPGDPRFKSARDAEALLRDPAGRGWWVAFERHHELWLYDLGFRRALGRIRLDRQQLGNNQGIEALATDGSALLAIPEAGNQVLRVQGSSVRPLPIQRPRGRISDAAPLPAGRLLVVQRSLTPFGFSNRLAVLAPDSGGFRYGTTITLPLSGLDNVEALAIEPRADGGARLWLMTDDNFHRPLRTLLVALDLPPGR